MASDDTTAPSTSASASSSTTPATESSNDASASASATPSTPSSTPTSSSSDHFLKIMIRNPTDVAGTPPYAVSVSPSSTVQQLKEQLNASYRDNPPITAQRLIYAGRLLQNSSKISAIITNPENSASHTFHLVVSSVPQPHSSLKSRSSMCTSSAPASSSRSSTSRGGLGASSSSEHPARTTNLNNMNGGANNVGSNSTTDNVNGDGNSTIGATTTGQTQSANRSTTFAASQLPSYIQSPHVHPYAHLYAHSSPYQYYNSNPYYQHYHQMMNYPLLPTTFTPHSHPTASSSQTPLSSRQNQTAATPEAYNAHLQIMERLLAESTQAELQAMNAESAAQTYLQSHNFHAAAQLRSYATQLHAHAAQLHMQTYAHARAHPLPPSQNSELNIAEMERLIAEAINGNPDSTLVLGDAQLHDLMTAPGTNGAGAAQPQPEQAAPAGEHVPLIQRHIQMLQQQFPVPPQQPQPQQREPQAQVPHPLQQEQPQQPQPQWGEGNRRELIQRGQILRGVNIRFARFPVDANGQLGEPRQFVFRFQLNWVLMLKLMVFVYVLSQDATPQRTYSLIGLAVVIYMWQMGYLRFVRHLVESALPNPRALIDRLFPGVHREQRDTEDDNNANNDEDGTGEVGRQRFGRIAVAFSFFYSFIYGFICSLLPAWNPEPHARINDLIPQEGRQAEGEQPRNDQGNNDGHEHAD